MTDDGRPGDAGSGTAPSGDPGTDTDPSAGPSVYDHFRPTDAGDADLAPGTYRIVGVHPGDVVVLRVADADGRRVHEGTVERVPRDRLDGFEPAENPDRGGRVARIVHALNHRPLERPLPFLAGMGLAVLGVVGESVLPVPGGVTRAVTVVGLLVVVAVFVLPTG